VNRVTQVLFDPEKSAPFSSEANEQIRLLPFFDHRQNL
jgi:hypothetical protein